MGCAPPHCVPASLLIRTPSKAGVCIRIYRTTPGPVPRTCHEAAHHIGASARHDRGYSAPPSRGKSRVPDVRQMRPIVKEDAGGEPKWLRGQRSVGSGRTQLPAVMQRAVACANKIHGACVEVTRAARGSVRASGREDGLKARHHIAGARLRRDRQAPGVSAAVTISGISPDGQLQQVDFCSE